MMRGDLHETRAGAGPAGKPGSGGKSDVSRLRHLQVLLVLCGAACLLMAGALWRLADRPVRTVLVPPGLGAEAWIEDERMSPSFHVEWGTHLAQLALSATPLSVDHQNRLLLRHVSPAIGGRFAAELDANAARLKELQASTFFSVRRALARPERGQVALVGFLSTYVRDRMVSEHPRSYVLEFRVAQGRPQLRSFRQTSSRDPFGDEKSDDPFAAGGAR